MLQQFVDTVVDEGQGDSVEIDPPRQDIAAAANIQFAHTANVPGAAGTSKSSGANPACWRTHIIS